MEVADDGKVEVEVAPCDMSTLHCIPLSTAKETSLGASGECRACGVSSAAADESRWNQRVEEIRGRQRHCQAMRTAVITGHCELCASIIARRGRATEQE